jgi:hypothetical protein
MTVQRITESKIPKIIRTTLMAIHKRLFSDALRIVGASGRYYWNVRRQESRPAVETVPPLSPLDAKGRGVPRHVFDA